MTDPRVPPSGPPPGPPRQVPQLPAYPPPRERSVSFFVAIFLGLLLLVSGALNVVLFVLGIGGLAASGLGGGGIHDDASYQMVSVAGDPRARNKVLRVPIAGVIMENPTPVLGAEGGTVSAVRRALAVAARDEAIRGVLLDIDSPGGGVTASDEIYRMVRAFRQEHPGKKVLALFGDIAASGGYYVAAAAERIVARRTTITGSIGVIMNNYNLAEAARKLGVEAVVIKSPNTPYKDILSPTRPMTETEHAMLLAIVEEMYQQFVTVVDDGRPNLDRSQVQALANGTIYSAGQALQNGLVDALGDRDDALAWFSQGLGSDVELLEYRRRPSLGELLFGVRAPSPPSLGEVASRLLQSATGPRFLYYWPGAR